MNYKASLIIISLASFGFGIVTDRLVFSTKKLETNKNSYQATSPSSSTIPKSEPSNYSSKSDNGNRKNHGSNEAENPFENQEKDPIDNLIDQIDAKKNAKLTLGGCIISREKKHIILRKEIKS